MTDKLAEVRKKIADILQEVSMQERIDGKFYCGLDTRYIDQILNTQITIEGGVCPECEGDGTIPIDTPFSGSLPSKDCLTCNGTGKLTKTIKQLIEEMGV